MFCKKYENAMKILESEIKIMHEIFLDALEMAKTAAEESDHKELMRFAEQCHCRFVALKELKSKIIEEAGTD